MLGKVLGADEERRAARQVGSLLGPERHGIGGEQMRTQRARRSGDLLWGGFSLDERLEFPTLADQPRLRRAWRKRRNALDNRSGKFAHLRIFGPADYLSAADGAAIIDGDIIKQAPRRLNVRLRRRCRRRKAGEQKP